MALAAAGAAGTVTLGVVAPASAPEVVQTSASVVIIGAGAVGIALANRLARRLSGAKISIIDSRLDHLYQSGLSLVAVGLKPASYVVSSTSDWLPLGVELIQQQAVETDPEAKTVKTSDGKSLRYDFLVVAPGLVLDHDAIEGFSFDIVGKNGICARYAGPDYAARTWQVVSEYTEWGGVGLSTRPATEMKCAGAPLKHTFLIDDVAKRNGNGGKIGIVYANNSEALFGVPIVAEKVRACFTDRGITAALSHVFKRIEPGKKVATFTTLDGDSELGYDYIYIVPPQRAPEFVRQSGLSWADKWIDQAWLEVDKHRVSVLSKHPLELCSGTLGFSRAISPW